MIGDLMIIEDINFWDRVKESDFDAMVCTTNNIVKNNGALVMGAGIAKSFRDNFPYLDLRWGKIIDGLKEGGYDDYNILIDGPVNWHNNYIYLVGLQTKRDWKDDSDIDLIVESCKKLSQLADALNWSKIILTKLGCGNGNLEWKDVSKKISKILDDRFIIIDFSADGV